MKTLIIPQKPSGTGSIHDIASDLYPREIQFPSNAVFALVLSSYYGDKYTTHCTADAVVMASKKYSYYSKTIVDIDGNHYDIEDGNLVQSEIKNDT